MAAGPARRRLKHSLARAVTNGVGDVRRLRASPGSSPPPLALRPLKSVGVSRRLVDRLRFWQAQVLFLQPLPPRERPLASATRPLILNPHACPCFTHRFQACIRGRDACLLACLCEWPHQCPSAKCPPCVFPWVRHGGAAGDPPCVAVVALRGQMACVFFYPPAQWHLPRAPVYRPQPLPLAVDVGPRASAVRRRGRDLQSSKPCGSLSSHPPRAAIINACPPALHTLSSSQPLTELG